MAIYDYYQSRAFAGMKATSDDDRVESYPVGASGLGFGLVCGTSSGVIVAGAGTRVRGLSLHSHTITGDGYVQYNSASVMTDGKAWCQVVSGATITEDGLVYYNAAGRVTSTASENTLLKGASFRSGAVTVVDAGDVSSVIALVEVHDVAVRSIET
jgi:hypothetical protein